MKEYLLVKNQNILFIYSSYFLFIYRKQIISFIKLKYKRFN